MITKLNQENGLKQNLYSDYHLMTIQLSDLSFYVHIIGHSIIKFKIIMIRKRIMNLLEQNNNEIEICKILRINNKRIIIKRIWKYEIDRNERGCRHTQASRDKMK